eukprot:TRINITY_DN6583_c0_g1_i1.p1 TRINITY_DN6583_c0_g1~~TRINITY_DN6583_c0_g1_i1.p1  ORF type:complete len:104 (+),score=15.01 TRINITY_DN6583_c0_g1_i1:167-478(+)
MRSGYISTHSANDARCSARGASSGFGALSACVRSCAARICNASFSRAKLSTISAMYGGSSDLMILGRNDILFFVASGLLLVSFEFQGNKLRNTLLFGNLDQAN